MAVVAGIPQLKAAIVALWAHSHTVFGRFPVSFPSPSALCSAVVHYDARICIPTESPDHMLLSDHDQQEILNCIVVCLIQRIDEDWNYVWVILTICEHAVHCMDIADKYYQILEVLYLWA